MKRIPRKAPLSELGRAAVAYAKAGFSVFPVGRNKKPLLSSWKPYQATPPSPAQVRSWWREWPTARIAIVTGAISNLVVVDADSLEARQCVRNLFGPTTRITRTRHGRPYYYLHPGHRVPNSTSKYAPNLDVRGDGGYIIVPPSPGYFWEEEGDWKDLPVYTPPTADTFDDPPLDPSIGVAEGQRNNQAARLAGSMLGRGYSVKETRDVLLEWNEENRPPLPEKELKAVVRSIARREGIHGKKTQRELVIECAGQAELWRDPRGGLYATVKVDGHFETLQIDSSPFRHYLQHAFYLHHGKAPGATAVKEAIEALASRARYQGKEHPIYLRVARRDDVVYLDLGDKDRRVARIDADGWTIIDQPPVKFLHPAGLQALPEPISGGSVEELRPLLNVATEDDFRLVVAFMLVALSGRCPYFLLAFHGEQGTAKSTMTRMVRGLFDPVELLLRLPPGKQQDLILAANGNYVVTIDNLSRLHDWFSDTLCSVVTGTGFATRQLYTNAEEFLFRVERPVILNGIPDVASLRGDLADRSLIIELPPIPTDQRRTEDALWRQFDDMCPRGLGALLDAVSCALRHEASVQLNELPRMADAVRWVSAAEPALGWSRGSFAALYHDYQHRVRATSAGMDPVVLTVQRFLSNGSRSWEGTASELLDALNDLLQTDGERGAGLARSKAWPKSPNWLSQRLDRVAPLLRAVGIDFDRRGRGKSETARKTIRLTLADPLHSTGAAATAEKSPSSFSTKGEGRGGKVRRRRAVLKKRQVK